MLSEIIFQPEDLIDLDKSSLELIQRHSEYNLNAGVHIDIVSAYWGISSKELHGLLSLSRYYYREGVH